MTRNRSVARGVILLGAVGALLLTFSFGCKKEEEPIVPGYYTGPIKPKGEAMPTAGGKGPGAAQTGKGGSSTRE